MDGLRRQLDRSLELLADTDERRVFAHLLAPHVPFLYTESGPASPPACWPGCRNMLAWEDTAESMADSMEPYLMWLNAQLLDMIDRILERRPDAEIVLFSDHGGRFDPDDKEEWHRIFLAGRTPGRPDLFAGSPHPRSLIPLLLKED